MNQEKELFAHEAGGSAGAEGDVEGESVAEGISEGEKDIIEVEKVIEEKEQILTKLMDSVKVIHFPTYHPSPRHPATLSPSHSSHSSHALTPLTLSPSHPLTPLTSLSGPCSCLGLCDNEI